MGRTGEDRRQVARTLSRYKARVNFRLHAEGRAVRFLLEPRASGRPDAGALQVRRLLFDNRRPTILHPRPRRGAALRRRTGDVKKGATFHGVAPFHGSNFAGDAIKNNNFI